MNIIVKTALATALLAPAPIASAEVYGAVRYGVAEAEASGFEFNEGRSYGAGLGYDFGLVRIEAEANRGTADAFGGAIEGELTNYSATGLVDFEVGGLTVFAGAGLDYSEAQANLGFTTIEGSGDGWHYDVGASTRINDAWDIELRRRAYDGSVDMDFIGELDVEATAWTIGLRKSF